MDFILEGLCESVKDKVGKFSSAKELWDKIHNLYFTKSHSTTNTEHANHNKEYEEDVELVWEEKISLGHIDSEEENYERHLTSALDKLVKERERNKSLEEELIKRKRESQNVNFEEVRQMITNLKFQVEDSTIMINEACKSELEEKQFLEEKIVAQRKEAEKRHNILTSHIKERFEDLNKIEEKFSQ
jgi:hypothetical protein